MVEYTLESKLCWLSVMQRLAVAIYASSRFGNHVFFVLSQAPASSSPSRSI